MTENGGRSTVSGSRAGLAKGSESAVVLAIDTSRSMQGKPIADAILAARAFALHRNPHQPLAIVTFNNKVNVLQPFTTDPSKIARRSGRRPKLAQGTKIYDGLDQSLSLIAKAQPASSEIVLLSDGADVGSVAKPAPVLRRPREAAHPGVLGRARLERVRSADARSGRRGERRLVRPCQPAVRAAADLRRDRRAARERVPPALPDGRRPPASRVAVKVVVRGRRRRPRRPTSPRGSSSRIRLRTSSRRPIGSSSPRSRWCSSSLVIALLLGLADRELARRRPDPLVHRVGGFVTLRSGARDRGAAAACAADGEDREPAAAAEPCQHRRAGSRPTLELAGIEQSATEVILLTLGATVLVAVDLRISWWARSGSCSRCSSCRSVRGRSCSAGYGGSGACFAEQLPDNLEVLTASLRSGHSLVGALAVVAADAQEPSKSEFNRVVADEQFGMPLEDALKVDRRADGRTPTSTRLRSSPGCSGRWAPTPPRCSTGSSRRFARAWSSAGSCAR